MSKYFEVKVSIFVEADSKDEAYDVVEGSIDDLIFNDKELKLQDYIVDKKVVEFAED